MAKNHGVGLLFVVLQFLASFAFHVGLESSIQNVSVATGASWQSAAKPGEPQRLGSRDRDRAGWLLPEADSRAI